MFLPDTTSLSPKQTGNSVTMSSPNDTLLRSVFEFIPQESDEHSPMLCLSSSMIFVVLSIVIDKALCDRTESDGPPNAFVF